MRRRSRLAAVMTALLAALLCGCPPREKLGPRDPPVRLPLRSVQATGLENVYRLSDVLYSGGGPQGDEGFASLKQLRIQSILSVDGARPDLDRAHKHGMRYAHLPLGYDGVPRDKALLIARAMRDLPRPVYVHCHHGKHRGPAAAGIALLCLDETLTSGEAVGWLRAAGTDENYQGLYASVRDFRRPTKEELDAVPADFPEAAEVGGLAKLMVEVDRHYDNLSLAKKAGWKVPPGHPDVDPPHEALQLAELYREAARLRGEGEVRGWLVEAQTKAKRLEAALREAKKGKPEAATKEVDDAFAWVSDDCRRCHVKHRDVPRGR